MLIREEIKSIIQWIQPCDDIEQEHILDAVAWIDGGADLFRIKKHATPEKHLVSYAVVLDSEAKKILLFNHKKSWLILPSGGHVDVDELPHHWARRELKEELDLELDFHPLSTDNNPLFVTVTDVVMTLEDWSDEVHTDVSLWYIFEGDSSLMITWETEDYKEEFEWFSWMSFEEILEIPEDKTDKHMRRFINKLISSMN